MKKHQGWYLPDSESHMTMMIDKAFKKTGRYEYQEIPRQQALKYCKTFDTAIDVGSHVGLWTKDLAKRFKKVLCFEPVQEFRDCWDKNIDATNTVLFPYALGEKNGTISMEMNPENTGNTHIDPKSTNGEIDMWKLDDILDITEISFIKIDVEGYEINVLKGAKETILKYKPVIVIEQKPHDFYGMKQYVARDYCMKELGMTVLKQQRDDFILGF